jgi:hypothetical protein
LVELVTKIFVVAVSAVALLGFAVYGGRQAKFNAVFVCILIAGSILQLYC